MVYGNYVFGHALGLDKIRLAARPQVCGNYALGRVWPLELDGFIEGVLY